MIKVNIVNDKQLDCQSNLSVREILQIAGYDVISREIVAARVNGNLVDLSTALDRDVELQPITVHEQEGLDIVRHSTAHLLAQAVMELYTGVQVTVGPAIEDGFYHDFYYPIGFSEEELPKIEQRMQELVQADLPIVRTVKSRQQAIEEFQSRGEGYKVKMLEDIQDEEISFYTQGKFTNFCVGPHVPSTGYLKAFKLTKLSGAYWKGDSQNEMLQRIYGTAWASKQELQDYVERLERAKLVDHRLIGKKMDLFHLQEEAPGIVFWHPKGWAIFTGIRKYLSDKLVTFGYQEVNTPIIVDRSLWEKSGHWENYKQVMFITESENHIYAVKPMNCPGQIQIFKQGLKSYRDLPIRYAEFGYCHRNEISGSLHGIMRVRGFTQDDGHIFCTEEQIASESSQYINQVVAVLADFGFDASRITVKLSTRPQDRIGTDALWDIAEHALAEVLNSQGLPWSLSPGEGAFYGPKIEFALKDSLGRTWQCGTLQVDFFMPERLGATYVDKEGERRHPVMLHRAMIGSLERFIGILLEETGGNLPFWLAPVQIAVLNITDAQAAYAQEIAKRLQSWGYRTICDIRNEKIGFKIREHSISKDAFILVVGNRELEGQLVAVRTSSGEELGQFALDQLRADVLEPKLSSKT